MPLRRRPRISRQRMSLPIRTPSTLLLPQSPRSPTPQSPPTRTSTSLPLKHTHRNINDPNNRRHNRIRNLSIPRVVSELEA